MRCVSLVSLAILLCCVCPLCAKQTDDADHAPIKIDPMPTGWNVSSNTAADTFLAMNDELAIVEIDSSYHAKDFQAFCKASMEREARGSSLQDRKATDPKPASVGPQGTLEYDITGRDGDVPKHLHIYMMPIRKTWGFMYCRCTEEQWETYKNVFKEMLKNAK